MVQHQVSRLVAGLSPRSQNKISRVDSGDERGHFLKSCLISSANSHGGLMKTLSYTYRDRESNRKENSEVCSLQIKTLVISSPLQGEREMFMQKSKAESTNFSQPNVGFLHVYYSKFAYYVVYDRIYEMPDVLLIAVSIEGTA
jgi:hypothetical protein